MGAELAPRRLRDVFVTVLFASFPRGGLIGSLTSAWIIPAIGWRSVFYIGTAAPRLVAVILAILLPESIRFLWQRTSGTTKYGGRSSASRPERFPRDATLITRSQETAKGAPVSQLFRHGCALPTLPLWVPFFMVFMILVAVTFWTPAVLRSVGFLLSAADLIVGFK
jgi:AAHS family 4-hydroxybenzoate transporter-like MFS transporter